MTQSKDIDDYNKDVEDHNRKVDECSGSGDPLYKEGCGIVFAKAMNLILLAIIAFVGLAWLQSVVTAPITDTPASTWAPVVNPASVSSGGYVPAMYVAEFPNGDRCYVTMGLLVDQTSCVKGVE